MKVFITGVAGFLGSHLADWFLNNGHEVIGIDNFFGGYKENIPKNAIVYNVDITDIYLPVLTMFMEDCDLVYHCAAAPYEGVSNFAPSFICDNIYSGSVNVFTAAIIAKVKRIVYCSSMARYGENSTPFHEYSHPNPVDPYGISKEAAERVLKNLCQTHGVEWNIAVPHNIYGPRQKYDDPYRNVASIMINRYLQDQQPIIYGDGEQRRCFSYIDDCVESLVKMGTMQDCLGETINIGPEGEDISINELARTIAFLLQKPFEPIYMPDRPREVKIAHCSAYLAKTYLGYEQKITLQQGLCKLIDWIKEKGPKPFVYHFDLEIINDKTPKTWTDRLI